MLSSNTRPVNVYNLTHLLKPKQLLCYVIVTFYAV